jgi:hypothetical protein
VCACTAGVEILLRITRRLDRYTCKITWQTCNIKLFIKSKSYGGKGKGMAALTVRCRWERDLRVSTSHVHAGLVFEKSAPVS